ncbi:MAG: monovalent cation:H+ antiporter-2, family [Desulfovibrionales bacterium]|nr:monovalent cation:H+ antiporter-2, family [Desulfovibrionales bacterium]
MPLLQHILILIVLSLGIVLICRRLGLPSVIGFLATGVLIGPYGFAVIDQAHEVDFLAEMGVILLLFTIGIEFSFKKLLALKRVTLIGGLVQVVATSLLVYAILVWGLHVQPSASLVFGFAVALSSTAICLKILQERTEMDAPHGRLSFGVLIFQDIVVVPMMLVIPLLSGEFQFSASGLLTVGAEALGVAALVAVLAIWAAPKLFLLVAKLRDQELFLLTVASLCLFVAWLTYSLGMSLALGAFLAGLIISESEFNHQALASVLPFRDVFTSFFFISIGMLLNVDFVLAHPLTVILAALAAMLLKILGAGFAAFLLGYPLRTVILAALALCQVGEFSFILAKSGVEYGLIADYGYQLFLSLTVVTMALAPLCIAIGPKAAEIVSRLPLPRFFAKGLYPVADFSEQDHMAQLTNHLIIVGYGLVGRQLALAARNWKIPHVIIEGNPETVRTERKKGVPIFFGDASRAAILDHAKMSEAKITAVTIPDPLALRTVVQLARNMNASQCIIVRSRYHSDAQELMKLGASEVVTEEYEASLEIFSRVLEKSLAPREEIERFAALVRRSGYNMDSAVPDSVASKCAMALPNMDIRHVLVQHGSAAEDETLESLRLRKDHLITVLALHRNGELDPLPGGDARLAAGDTLVLAGQIQHLRQAKGLFESTANPRSESA